MTKYFCDICGKEGQHAETLINMVENKKGVGDFQVRVSFQYVNHPRGYGGPPELCKSCMADLINALMACHFVKKKKAPEPRP